MSHSWKAISLIMGCLIYSSVGYPADSQHKTKNKSERQLKRLKINPITEEKNAWTANAETNVYRNSSFQNITLGYSSSNGWDFSLSLVNTQILGANKQFQGNTFFNVAKTFTMDDFSIIVGSQNGVAMLNTYPRLWYDFSYLDSRYDVTPWLLIHGGVYFANAALTNTSNQVGFLAGTEVTLIPNTLALQLDYISGHHSLSGGTVNLLVNITAKFQIYMGMYVPEQNSGNDFAGILGFNLSTQKL